MLHWTSWNYTITCISSGSSYDKIWACSNGISVCKYFVTKFKSQIYFNNKLGRSAWSVVRWVLWVANILFLSRWFCKITWFSYFVSHQIQLSHRIYQVIFTSIEIGAITWELLPRLLFVRFEYVWEAVWRMLDVYQKGKKTLWLES